MKATLLRLFSLVLVLLMAVACFVACKPNDVVTKTDVQSTVSLIDDVVVEVDKSAPYEIAKSADGKDVIILTPGENDTVIMTVAENTTLETFLSLVTAKEGYTIKVTDPQGNEVTDKATVIAKDMVFAVYADGATEAEVTMTIHVETAEKIAEKVEEQEKIEETNSQIIQNNPVISKPKEPINSPVAPPPPSIPESTPHPITTINLGTLYPDVFDGNSASGKAYSATFANMKRTIYFDTKIASVDPNTVADTVVKEAMAGKTSNEIYHIDLHQARAAAKQKAAANLYSSKTLNKSLYDNAGTQSITFNGKAYGIAFDGMSLQPMGVFYNKDLIKKYAPQYDIGKLYETKKWTFETLREIAKLCTVDADGDNKLDFFGITSNTNIIGMALSANAGGTATMKNGRVEATMCNDSGIEALQFCKDLFTTDRTWNYMANIMDCVNSFATGESAMFASYFMYSNYITDIANFNVGFVLMPIGPDQKDYVNGFYTGQVFMVPVTMNHRLDELGNWFNGVAAVSTKLINAKITEMARNGYDSTAQAAVKWVAANMTAEFAGCFSAQTTKDVDGSVTNPTGSPAKVMKAIQSRAQSEADDFYKDLY